MKIIKKSLSLVAVALILSLSVLTCFAKGDLTLDKGVSADCKDKVTYTLYLGDCDKPVVDMVAHLFYDSAYLKLDKDSVSFHDLSGVNSNTNIDGQIHFSFSAIGNPIDFKKSAPIISADFTVLKDGKSAIEYFITDLDCGSPDKSQTAKRFKFTCDYVVHSKDGDKAYTDCKPILLSDKEKTDANQGSFINYSDGKGEQAKADKKHIAVTGETQANIIDVTKDAPSDDNANNNTTIIITVVIIVILLIIAIIGVLRRVFGSEHNSPESVTDDKPDEIDENE